MTCTFPGCTCQQAKPMEPPADIRWVTFEDQSDWLSRWLMRLFRRR